MDLSLLIIEHGVYLVEKTKVEGDTKYRKTQHNYIKFTTPVNKLFMFRYAPRGECALMSQDMDRGFIKYLPENVRLAIDKDNVITDDNFTDAVIKTDSEAVNYRERTDTINYHSDIKKTMNTAKYMLGEQQSQKHYVLTQKNEPAIYSTHGIFLVNDYVVNGQKYLAGTNVLKKPNWFGNLIEEAGLNKPFITLENILKKCKELGAGNVFILDCTCEVEMFPNWEKIRFDKDTADQEAPPYKRRTEERVTTELNMNATPLNPIKEEDYPYYHVTPQTSGKRKTRKSKSKSKTRSKTRKSKTRKSKTKRKMIKRKQK